MNPSPEQLAQVCAIAHDTSRRGVGRSLRDAINLSHYRELRPHLTEPMIASYVAEHPELVRQWSMYSNDKRTHGGYYFLERDGAWVIGSNHPQCNPEVEYEYSTAANACAYFILVELDFWANLH